MQKNNSNLIYQQAQKELQKYADTKRKKTNEWFFKTGKGEYGEGDIFIGVRVPDIRKVAVQFSELNLVEVGKFLQSSIHEERLLALLILVAKFKKGDTKKQAQIYKFYLNSKNRKRINNWDLVDLSAQYIVGQYILNNPKEKKILNKLVSSKLIWDRRIAIIATWMFICEGEITDTLRLSKKLLNDKEDLIHKAVGWMLREAWKKDFKKVEEFLIKNYKKLPRTTLRYAIERMERPKRKRFLKGDF